eukprot:3609352-Pleurochrysis_carterae.AAC.1
MADYPNPNGSPKPLPTQKRDRRGNYVLVETLEETGLGRDTRTKDKDGMEEVSTVPKPSGMDMAGTPEVTPSRNARPLDVRNDAYSGLLARVRGSSDLRAIKASRASRVGSKDKGHLK